MIYHLKLLIEPELVNDLLLDLQEIDSIKVQFEQAIDIREPELEAFGQLRKKYPYFSWDTKDVIILLLAIPSIITSITGLAKVLLDHNTQKPEQNQSVGERHSHQGLALIKDGEVIPLSEVSDKEELTRLLEKARRSPKLMNRKPHITLSDTQIFREAEGFTYIDESGTQRIWCGNSKTEDVNIFAHSYERELRQWSIGEVESTAKGSTTHKPKTSPIKILYCYASADREYRDQLAIHLSQLKHDGLIEEWHDQQILAGSNRAQEVDQAIRSAQIILLLISADFLASYDIEMQRALEQHGLNLACVLPIILRPCDWLHSPLKDLQCLPHDGRPVTEWNNSDAAFFDIAKGLRKVISSL